VQVKNVSIQEMYEALKAINEKYLGNIIFKRLDQKGKLIIFTLKVKNANKKHGSIKGRALNFGYLKKQENPDYPSGSYASSGSACWHVHGYFFEALLKINSFAVIVSVIGTINKDGGNWQDKEVGSPYYGYLNMSELCECSEWDKDINPSLSLSEKLKTVEVKSIKQSDLTGECWIVQFSGIKACEECEYLNTSDCGGKKIRKTLMNEKGKKVPL
jgi:hypothetical protein